MPFPPFKGAGQGAMDCSVFLGEQVTGEWVREVLQVATIPLSIVRQHLINCLKYADT